jgi:GT2 family glycosyltransferase
MTDIAIIVVGFSSRKFLPGLMESIRAADWKNLSYQVVYVDNASSDDSVSFVREHWTDAIIIANPQNAGFTKACNQGVAATHSRYIYLLNVDTRLLPNSVVPLVAFLDSHPTTGAVGNRLLNADGSEQWSARRFPTGKNALFGRRSYLARRYPDSRTLRTYLYKDELQRGEPFRVDWVPGSCTLVRREVYEQVGGLPEDLHYWSDAIFCDRIWKQGWEISLVPSAPLFHFEGTGTGENSAAIRNWLISDFHRGAYRFYCEHYNLATWNPLRWIAKVGLTIRAAALKHLRSPGVRTTH